MKKLLIILLLAPVIGFLGCREKKNYDTIDVPNSNYIFSDSVRLVYNDSSIWTHKDTLFWKHYGRIDTCFYDSTEVINDSTLMLCSKITNQ